MSKGLFPHDFFLNYNDYKTFSDFVRSNNSICQKFINPFEFFRIDNLPLEEASLKNYANSFFKGRHVKLPKFDNSNNDFCDDNYFEKYTGRDEVNHISLWGLSCLKAMSFSCEPRLGKELEIFIDDNPRNGRLDLAALANNEVLVLESKTSLPALIREGRYINQIQSYYSECHNVINKFRNSNNVDYRFSIFLFIGGDETYLYPPNHPDCVLGQVGKISHLFYNNIINHNIKFISANSLWSLATYAQIHDKEIPWFEVFPKYFRDKDHLGFLSGGRVVLMDNQPTVIPLELDI